MSVLLLVRHGQASFGAADYDRLSPLGEQQARILGASLAARGVVPDLVVRGSLRRHRQTTVAVLEGAGWDLQVAEDADWDEFDQSRAPAPTAAADEAAEARDELGVGAVEPLQASLEDQVRIFEESVARWAHAEDDEDYLETSTAFRERVERALRSVLDRLEAGQTAVVFTSGGPVSWVTAAMTEGGVTTWQRLADVVVNTSVTKVVTGARGATLISFNDHSHLEHDLDLISYR